MRSAQTYRAQRRNMCREDKEIRYWRSLPRVRSGKGSVFTGNYVPYPPITPTKRK